MATLLGTPAATGLFRRAIVQSGGAHVHSVEEAERSAERLAAVLGIASCTRDVTGAGPGDRARGRHRGDRASGVRTRG